MKWFVTFLSAVALAVLAMVFCTTPVLAQSPLAISGDSLTVSVKVDEAGGWTAYIGEDQVGITAADFGGLMKLIGMDIGDPVLDPSMVKMATDNGITSLALVKDGENTTVFVNDAPVTAVHLTNAAVNQVTQSFVPELEGMVSWLNTTKLALVAYFPGPSGSDSPKVTLSATVPAAPVGSAPPNVVGVGATISQDGELVSVAGVPAAELGLDMGQMSDVSWLIKSLGVDSADLSLDAYGASLSAGGEEWASISWDIDALVEAAPDIANAAGFPLASEDVAAISLGVDWLKDSQVTVAAMVGDTVQETAPTVEIGRAVQIAVMDNKLVVEGFDTGFLLDDYMMGYVKQIGSASVTWDGQNRELRTLVGGKAMPAIVADQGFVSTVGAATMGASFLPWDTLEQLVSQTSLAADFVYSGTTVPAGASVDYKAIYQEPSAPMSLDLTVSRKDGRVAAFGEALPLDLIDPSLSQQVLWAVGQAGPDLKSLSLDIGPTGLRVGVNGSHAELVWDSTMRDNAIGLALDISGKEFAMPALSGGLVRTGLQYLLGAANQLELGVNLTFTDDAIPQGSIESLAKQVLLY